MWFTGRMVADPPPSLVATHGGAQLLTLLRDARPRSRADIAEATGWARKTVESRLEELSSRGLVTSGEARRTGGRPSTSFRLDAAARLVLVADLGHTHAAVALTDLAGEVLAVEREDLDLERGPEDVIAHVTSKGRLLLERVGRARSDIAAVGIGLPSPVDSASGRALNPIGMHGWFGDDVKARIAQELPVPVHVDNDVNLMACGEWSRVRPDARDLLFVKVATGIGAGIIAGGRLQRGATGFAGDIGHIPLPGSDRPCLCGNVGCLAETAALRGMATSLRGRGVEVQTDSDVIALVADGDADALQVLRQSGREIGDVLVSAVGLLSPAHLVIGGPWGSGVEQLIAGVRETVYGRGFPLATQGLTIDAARTGDLAAIYGGAAMAVEASLRIV